MNGRNTRSVSLRAKVRLHILFQKYLKSESLHCLSASCSPMSHSSLQNIHFDFLSTVKWSQFISNLLLEDNSSHNESLNVIFVLKA